MTLIAEDLLLLLLNDETGKALVDSTSLDRVLAGGLLVELSLTGQIAPAAEGEAVKKGRLVVRDAAPTSDELLDRTLTRLATKPVKPERAVEQLTKGLRKELLTRLAGAGLLREQRGRALGIFPTTSWPAIDVTHETQLRAELTEVLEADRPPSERTAALVSLLAAVDAAAKVIGATDKRAAKRRAKELAAGEWAGAAVKRAVDSVNAAVAVAVVASTTGAATASN